MTCDHVEVSDDMPEVLAAHRAYKQADADALAMRAKARARLGRAVAAELDKPGSTQGKVAAKLGVVPEQVRRYRQAYRDWLKEHDAASLD